MVTEQDLITKLIEMVSQHVKPSIPINIALWDNARVAEYLCRDHAVVRDRISAMPTFPRAIRLPTAKGKGHPLYKASEIIKWAEKYQDKH
jgi:hypothetical protein